MAELERTSPNEEMQLVMQEIKENPFQKFEVAFALMSIIPFLVFVYLLATRLFTVDVLIGDIGLVLFISITLSLCGFFIGYNIISRTLKKVVFYAAKAKHSDQVKSKFLATVSHDLRNPLFVLDANVTDLEKGQFGEPNEKQKGILEICRGVINRMTELVDNLLDIYKIEAGMVKLQKKPCDMSAVLEEQMDEMRVIVEKKRLNLTKEVQKDADLVVNGDESKLIQVINNILGNAMKFTPEEGKINVKVFSTNGFVRIECKDTAASISPEDLHKIFDKFERLDTDKKGSGLGLAIAKDIVELHKGKIWAESVPKQGNTFIVVLPRNPE
jgi:signal transduction histidine kinase